MKERAGIGNGRISKEMTRRVRAKGFSRNECDGALRRVMDGIFTNSLKKKNGATDIIFFGSQVWIFTKNGTLITTINLNAPFVAKINTSPERFFTEEAAARWHLQKKKNAKRIRDAVSETQACKENAIKEIFARKCPELAVTGFTWDGDRCGSVLVRYASENAYSDEARYLFLLNEMRTKTDARVRIKHAKNRDGKYLTVSEYKKLKGVKIQ